MPQNSFQNCIRVSLKLPVFHKQLQLKIVIGFLTPGYDWKFFSIKSDCLEHVPILFETSHYKIKSVIKSLKLKILIIKFAKIVISKKNSLVPGCHALFLLLSFSEVFTLLVSNKKKSDHPIRPAQTTHLISSLLWGTFAFQLRFQSLL